MSGDPVDVDIKPQISQLSDENDVSDRLVIVTDQEAESEKKVSRKRKLSDSTNSSDEEDFKLPDIFVKVEQNLSAAAAKNNLTAENVKKILKRVVLNEHVLAIVKLREEEIETNDNPVEPKLTRSKTKKLKNTASSVSWPLPITPVKLSESAASLGLPSLDDKEESDDENNDNSEDQTDDEKDATESDFDSELQKSVESADLILKNVPSPVKYSEDGFFKIPENIDNFDQIPETSSAQNEVDIIWRDFINEFSQPFLNNNEEDDEADPEYNVTADPVDEEEELSEDPDVEVSKEELKDLCIEVMCGLERIDFSIEDFPIMGPNTNIPISFTNPDEIHLDATSPVKLMNISKSEPICQNNLQDYNMSNNHIENKPYTENPGNLYSLTINNMQEAPIEYVNQMDSITNGSEVSVPVNSDNSHNYNGIEQESNLNSTMQTVDLNGSYIMPDLSQNDTTDCNEMISFEAPSSDKNEKKRGRVLLSSDYKKWLFKEGDGQLLPNQRTILDQQMRQHVQLATQVFVQTYGHPKLSHLAAPQLELLMTLKYLGNDNFNSAFVSCNLLNAIKFCESWKERLSNDSEDSKKLIDFVTKDNERALRRKRQRGLLYGRFAPLITNTVLSSSGVFLYPELLPSVPIRPQITETNFYLDCEDQLIAMGLEQFYDYLNANKKTQCQKGLRLQYSKISELIVKSMMPGKSIERVKCHISTMKNSKVPNPINYYYKYYVAPKTIHTILPYDNTKILKEHDSSNFPIVWSMVFSKRPSRKWVFLRSRADVRVLRSRQYNRSLVTNYSLDPPNSDSSHSSPLAVTSPVPVREPYNFRKHFPPSSSRLTLRPKDVRRLLAHTDPAPVPTQTPSQPFTDNSDTAFNLSQIEHPFHPTPEVSLDHILDRVERLTTLVEYLCQENPNLSTDTGLLKGQTLITEYFLPSHSPEQKEINHQYRYYLRSLRLLHLLKIVKNGVSESISECIVDNKETLTLQKARIQLKRNIGQIYAMLPSMPFLSGTSKKSQEASDDSNEVAESIPAKTDDVSATTTQKQTNKKTTSEDSKQTNSKSAQSNNPIKLRQAGKMRREQEANRAMFLTNNPYADELKETLFAAAYMDKVHVRLTSQNTGNYVRFQEILNSFESTVDTPINLYRKLEQLFGEENSDLTEEFLTFLTPGQASEIGRFMDHFMLTSMSDFIERLQIFFTNKPAKLKKVLWNLEKLSEKEGELTMENVKTQILPLLKENQYLTDWFMKLFSDEKPPDSLTNSGYEVLDCDKISKDGIDKRTAMDYEILDVPAVEEHYGNETCTCSCHESTNEKFKNKLRHCLACGIKYIQGRVFVQNGRMLRGVHLNWQDDSNGQVDQARRLSAPISTREIGTRNKSSKNDSDDERVSPKRAAKVLRTPTSKGKSSKILPCNKNLNKTVDSPETVHKPSCSKSIIRDDDSIKSSKKSTIVTSQSESQTKSAQHDDYFESFDEFELIRAKTIKGELPAVRNEKDANNEQLTDEPQSKKPADNRMECTETVQIKSEFPQTDIEMAVADDRTAVTVKTEEVSRDDDSNWTRDEDKILLLILRSEETNHEETVRKVKSMLPQRTSKEIDERFLSVINLLHKITAEPD